MPLTGGGEPSGEGLQVPEGGEEFGEKADVRIKRQPVKPSPKEVDEHEADHYPPRSWCRHCVAGHGRLDRHASVATATRDEGIDTVVCDYMYFNDVAKEDFPLEEADAGAPAPASRGGFAPSSAASHTPILVAKDRRFQSLFATAVGVKGADPFAVREYVDFVSSLGVNRVKLRSDGEPAIRSLVEAASVELRKKNIEIVPDKTPVADSQAAGLQESAVHQIKCKARTLWHQAQELHGIKTGEDHATMVWCVRYAARLINRTHKGPDGRSSWARVTGRREFVRPLVPWGEKVLYAMGGHKHKVGLETKLPEGIFLDMVDTTNEYVIGTPQGIVKSGSVKRVSKEDARDPELFRSITTRP